MKFPRRPIFSVIMPLLAVFTTAATAQTPPVAPVAMPMVSVSPEFVTAVQSLWAPSTPQRREAMTKVQDAYADLARDTLDLQGARPPGQLQVFMHWNAGFTRWLDAMLAQSPDTARAAITWGLQRPHLLLVSCAYSPVDSDRLDVVQKLAKIDDPQARNLLDNLLRDPDRPVHLAALDALWDAQPTVASVDALWDRAVLANSDKFRNTDVASAPVQFHGMDLPSYSTMAVVQRSADAVAASELLARYHSPLVTQKIVAFLELSLQANQSHLRRYLGSGVCKAFLKSVTNNHSPQVEALIYQLAISDLPDTDAPAAVPALWSSHLSALYTLLTLTQQNAGAYRLASGMYSNISEADQAFAVEKFKTWWAVHGSGEAAAKNGDAPQEFPTGAASLPPPTIPSHSH